MAISAGTDIPLFQSGETGRKCEESRGVIHTESTLRLPGAGAYPG